MRPGPAAALHGRLVERGFILDDAATQTPIADVSQQIIAQVVKFTAAARDVQIASEAVS
jgi:hypothetical protein